MIQGFKGFMNKANVGPSEVDLLTEIRDAVPRQQQASRFAEPSVHPIRQPS